jgi:hypothetical protein
MSDLLYKKFVALYINKHRVRGFSRAGGKWYPAEEESCSCCSSIRSPSHGYPYSLYKHCQSRKHIKEWLIKQGVVSSQDLPLLINREDALGRVAKEVLSGGVSVHI